MHLQLIFLMIVLTDLGILGHLVEEVDVLALEVEGEIGVVVAVHDVRPGRLAGEAGADGGAHRVPEGPQVEAVSLGCEGQAFQIRRWSGNNNPLQLKECFFSSAFSFVA